METDIKTLKSPEQANKTWDEVKEKIDTIVSDYDGGKFAIEIDDKKIIKMWEDNIAPLHKDLKPFDAELVEISDKLAEIQEEWKELYEETMKKKDDLDERAKPLQDRMQEIQDEIRPKLTQKNKFVARLSDLVQNKYGEMLTEFQDFGRIVEDEENKKLYVKVQDWISAFIDGHRKRAAQQEDSVVADVDPKMLTYTDEK